MQSCRLNNIQHKMVNIKDPASWDVPVLIVNEIGLMSDSEIKALLDYVKAGNTLIVSGSNAIFDEKSVARNSEAQLLLDCKMLDADEVKTIELGKGKLIKVGYAFGYPGSDEYKKTLFVDNPKRFKFLSIIDHIKELAHIADSFDDRKNPSAAAPGKLYSAALPAFRQIAELLKGLLPEPEVAVQGLPEGVLYSIFEDNKANLVVQMLNASECFAIPEGDVVSHKDMIPFPKHSGKAKIVLNTSHDNCEIKLVTFDSETTLTPEKAGVSCMLDLEKITMYAMLKIKK